MNEQSIRISHAHKYYNKGRQNEIHVLNDVDLTLPESGMVAIFGQSGCGKTTLLNTVGGLDRIQSGSISLFGQDMGADTDTLRNKYTGFIFQNYNLNVTETVLENVADALRLCGMTDKEEIIARSLNALRCVDMDKYRDRTPDTLSGGQQQRVAIARAIVKSPAVILADEPTGNLDENNTVMVMDILKEISRTRLVLLVTHEANLVDYYCNKVIEMSDGQIVGIRENGSADGYVKRNKNDIWLGELEKREENIPGVNVTCYGDMPADKPVSIRLICENGRLYLKCDTPGVKLLDESSEITLREGVFADTAKKNADAPAHKAAHLDMSALTPFEGHDYGRLFRFKGAMGLAWRENYSKKKKKGNKFFRVCLVVLAFVMVIMTAAMAVDVREYADAMADHNENLFFLPLEVSEDGTPAFDYNALLSDAEGQNGIDYVGISQWAAGNSRSEISFDTAKFMTAKAPQLSAAANILPASKLGSAKTVCGEADCKEGGMVITTAFADDLLENSTVSYINTYDDLIGLVKGTSEYRYAYSVFEESPSDAPGVRFHIAGVVESDERLIYVNDLDCARNAMNQINIQFGPVSAQTAWTGKLNPGELVVMVEPYNQDSFKVGEKIRIFGRDFTVKELAKRNTDLSGFLAFYEAQTGHPLPDFAAYVEENNIGDGKEERMHAFSEWLFGVVYPQMPAYVRTMQADFISDYHYGVGYANDLPAFACMMIGDSSHGITFHDPVTLEEFGFNPPEYLLDNAYQMWVLRGADGSWPTAEEVESALSDNRSSVLTLYKMNADSYWEGLNEIWNHRKASDFQNVIVSDEDYLLLAGSAGQTDDRVGGNWIFQKQDYEWMGEVYYNCYMMIHASDPDAAEAWLTSTFGNVVETPASIFADTVKDARGTVLAAVISVTVVLAFMCLSVFFIMRSSFMSRVKEVGILRAIGVTRKNMVYRFFVETVMLTLMTVGIGYALAWWLVTFVQGGVLLSEMMYFPVWIALPELIIILAACLVFGILPALTLLRRTPSEILAKYDI